MHPSPEQRTAFGERLRELRTARGLSLLALAAALADAGHKITQQALSAWELGEYAPQFPAIVEAAETILGTEGELVGLLGFPEGPTLLERVSSLEERVAALEAARNGRSPRRR